MQYICPKQLPYRHLAAVIYKVSAENDNNLLPAFSLHRVDLPAELKKENIHIQQHYKNDIPLLKTFYCMEKSQKIGYGNLAICIKRR